MDVGFLDPARLAGLFEAFEAGAFDEPLALDGGLLPAADFAFETGLA